MKPLRIVFMGTPDFAVPTLQALIDGPHEVVGVYCQPDKAKGRGKKLQMPPVKETALAANLPVYQPLRFSDEGCREALEALAPDLIIVIAYGKILPKWVLELPPYGCINLHASILPKYRGAAPIHWSIWNGDTVTGLTIMQMNEGLDTGDILKIIKTDIQPEETTGELFTRLGALGGACINEVLEELVTGHLTPVPQEEAQASYTQKITKEMGFLNWRKSAEELANQIRALNPAPGCVTFLQGKRLKVWRAKALPIVKNTAPACAYPVPGMITRLGEEDFTVMTGDSELLIQEVQPDSKKQMKAGDYCRGYQVKVGMTFDEQ